jgi:hypothetical protein
LPAGGMYTVTVESAGFAPLTSSTIQLITGSSAELRFVLHVAGQASTITVEGLAGDTRVDEPQLGIYLSGQQIYSTRTALAADRPGLKWMARTPSTCGAARRSSATSRSWPSTK